MSTVLRFVFLRFLLDETFVRQCFFIFGGEGSIKKDSFLRCHILKVDIFCLYSQAVDCLCKMPTQ